MYTFIVNGQERNRTYLISMILLLFSGATRSGSSGHSGHDETGEEDSPADHGGRTVGEVGHDGHGQRMVQIE